MHLYNKWNKCNKRNKMNIMHIYDKVYICTKYDLYNKCIICDLCNKCDLSNKYDKCILFNKCVKCIFVDLRRGGPVSVPALRTVAQFPAHSGNWKLIVMIYHFKYILYFRYIVRNNDR